MPTRYGKRHLLKARVADGQIRRFISAASGGLIALRDFYVIIHQSLFENFGRVEEHPRGDRPRRSSEIILTGGPLVFHGRVAQFKVVQIAFLRAGINLSGAGAVNQVRLGSVHERLGFHVVNLTCPVEEAEAVGQPVSAVKLKLKLIIPARRHIHRIRPEVIAGRPHVGEGAHHEFSFRRREGAGFCEVCGIHMVGHTIGNRRIRRIVHHTVGAGDLAPSGNVKVRFKIPVGDGQLAAVIGYLHIVINGVVYPLMDCVAVSEEHYPHIVGANAVAFCILKGLIYRTPFIGDKPVHGSDRIAAVPAEIASAGACQPIHPLQVGRRFAGSQIEPPVSARPLTSCGIQIAALQNIVVRRAWLPVGAAAAKRQRIINSCPRVCQVVEFQVQILSLCLLRNSDGIGISRKPSALGRIGGCKTQRTVVSRGSVCLVGNICI